MDRAPREVPARSWARSASWRMAVMLVEHHMDLVMGVCDDIMVLDFGRRIARGTTAR